MGLEETRAERDVAGFGFPDGTGMEIWRSEDPSNLFFGSGPVVGFRVDGVEEARARMEAEGVEFTGFTGPVRRTERAAWGRFRGPDGNVYEVIGRPVGRPFLPEPRETGGSVPRGAKRRA